MPFGVYKASNVCALSGGLSYGFGVTDSCVCLLVLRFWVLGFDFGLFFLVL